MQFYKSDLFQYISGSISDTDLLKQLTELGLEVDQSKKEKNDLLVKLDLTPNRGDCLSVNGVIRDLSVFYKNKNKPLIYDNVIPNLDINFSNLSIDSCPSISFIRIKVQNVHSEYKEYYT